jgi:hypothetical protein
MLHKQPNLTIVLYKQPNLVAKVYSKIAREARAFLCEEKLAKESKMERRGALPRTPPLMARGQSPLLSRAALRG